jgi:transcriptional regulator with XRE-family HTH domain
MKIFAERLKELRAEEGISAETLGKKLNISDTTIIRWENNQSNIKGEHLVRLAKFFNVSTDYLLGLED